jgi:hypothetical protein
MSHIMPLIKKKLHFKWKIRFFMTSSHRDFDVTSIKPHHQLFPVCLTIEAENSLNQFLTSHDNECEKLVRGQFFLSRN